MSRQLSPHKDPGRGHGGRMRCRPTVRTLLGCAPVTATMPGTMPVVLIAEELAPSVLEVLGSDVEIRHVDGADRAALLPARSEERRVGKECRSRWSPYH